MERYKVAIVGSGPAGLSAAGRAAALDRDAGTANPSYILLEARSRPSERSGALRSQVARSGPERSSSPWYHEASGAVGGDVV